MNRDEIQPVPEGTPSGGDGDALRVVLAAGGTGGHLMPAVAIGEALARRADCEFLVVGSPRAGERELRSLVPWPTVEIRARPLAGGGVSRRLRGLAAVPGAVLAAARHLRRFRPDLVIATGGYVCGPTGLAAWLSGIPLLVAEQNAEPGLTTRLLRPFARAIAVSFEPTAEALGDRATLTGNPVRATLPAAPHRDGRPRGGRGDGGVHLLVLGGSQGAHGLNVMVELAIPTLAEADVPLTVTHQTGVADVERLDEAWRSHGVPATVTPFIQAMGEAYARADLVCARAGATTVAELAYCGLPSILVPYPHAAGRHQHANARALADAGAALLVEEAAEGRPLAEAVVDLASDPRRLAEMAAAAARCGRDDAAAAVADLALEILGRAVASRSGTPGADAPSSPASRSLAGSGKIERA